MSWDLWVIGCQDPLTSIRQQSGGHTTGILEQIGFVIQCSRNAFDTGEKLPGQILANLLIRSLGATLENEADFHAALPVRPPIV